MANTAIFPNTFNGNRLRELPAFPGEGLRTRRVAIQASIPRTVDIDPQFLGFAPLAALEIDPDSATLFTREQIAAHSYYKVGDLCSDPRPFFENDTATRFTVSILQMRATEAPLNTDILPGLNDVMSTVEFQLRASIAGSPGDIRWWGVLNNAGTLTFNGANGLLGVTQEGVLATQWEVWGRVRDGVAVTVPLACTLVLSIDRTAYGPNLYGNPVTPVVIPAPVPIPPP